MYVNKHSIKEYNGLSDVVEDIPVSTIVKYVEATPTPHFPFGIKLILSESLGNGMCIWSSLMAYYVVEGSCWWSIMLRAYLWRGRYRCCPRQSTGK